MYIQQQQRRLSSLLDLRTFTIVVRVKQATWSRVISKAICACAILLTQISRAEKLMRAENGGGDEKQVIDLEWP